MTQYSLDLAQPESVDGIDTHLPRDNDTEHGIAESVSQTTPPPDGRHDNSKGSKGESKGQHSVALLSGVLAIGAAIAGVLITHHASRSDAELLLQQSLRKDLLTTTSNIIVSFHAARRALVMHGFDAAAPLRVRYDHDLHIWARSRLVLLDRARSAFGPDFALLIETPESRTYVTDKCGVLVLRQDPDRSKNCTTRLAHEVRLLNQKQDSANLGKDLSLEGTGVVMPQDFGGKLRAANSLYERVSDCTRIYKGPAAKLHPPVAERCPDLTNLKLALNLRGNLLSAHQDIIAGALPH